MKRKRLADFFRHCTPTNRTNLELKHPPASVRYTSPYPTNRTNLELKPNLSPDEIERKYATNRTNLELKLISISPPVTILSYQSYQSGIETNLLHHPRRPGYAYQSYQSGIETLQGRMNMNPAHTTNRTNLELKHGKEMEIALWLKATNRTNLELKLKLWMKKFIPS